MVNKERMVSEFMQLIRVDSITRKERLMADTLKRKLEEMGLSAYEDNAGEAIGGNAGNIICNIEGNKNVPAIVLMAHMDTVEPGIGKVPVLSENYIKSDGRTVLGGDDVIGIEAILETIRVLKENNIPHGDIQVVFTVGEEASLLGAKNLDFSKIFATYGIVLDSSGPVGKIIVKAPSKSDVRIVIKGKAAHAGIEPEKGINAIQIAAHAISQMKLGRIDFETTANIGIINGGIATNIVCDYVELRADVRSRVQEKMEEQIKHMKECVEQSAEIYGGTTEFIAEQDYISYVIPEDSEILSIISDAAEQAGIKFSLGETGGGSDANVFNCNGIQSIVMSIGMEKVHSTEEQVAIDELVRSAELLTAIVANIR